MNTTTYQKALKLYNLGLSVIPIKERDKRPVGKWSEFQNRRFSLNELEKTFFDKNYNIGIPTGYFNKIIVVDADSEDAVAYMDKHHPSPWRVTTSRGQHFYFKHPGIKVKNGVHLLGMALDVRGDGGYVIAPGSTHPSGHIYEPIGDWSIFNVDLLPLFDPSWVAAEDKKTNKLSNIDKAIEYLKTTSISTEGDGGDIQAFKIAAFILDKYKLDHENILNLMLSYWNNRCIPPWSEDDLKIKIENAFKYSNNSKNSMFHGLLLDSKGNIKSSPGNLAKIFREHERFGDRLTLNTMNIDVFYDKQPLSEYSIDDIQEWLENVYGVPFPKREDIISKLISQASKNSYHPVQEYLKSLPAWDGINRISRIPNEILCAEENSLNEAYVRCFFIGAVRRAMIPGVKMDTVLILVGPQGIGKSTFFKILGGEWFSDSFIDPGTKDSYLQLASAWVYELPEVDWIFGKKASETVKAFLSSSFDTFRPPYARKTISHPRSSVMVGTTNRMDFLTDPTGHRRFHIIKATDKIDINKIAQWRDMIWAEAYNLYKNNKQHWLDYDEELLQDLIASEFESVDPWEHSLYKLGLELQVNNSYNKCKMLSISEILGIIGIENRNAGRRESIRLGALLRKSGWIQLKMGKDSNKVWKPPFINN